MLAQQTAPNPDLQLRFQQLRVEHFHERLMAESVELPRSVKMLNAELLKSKIVGPFVLGSAYPELSKHLLAVVLLGFLCVTWACKQ